MPNDYDPLHLTNAGIFGRLVRQWAMDAASRPKTLAEFKAATANCLIVPDRIEEDPQYPQWTTTNLIVRLPSKVLLQRSEEKFSKNEGEYPLEPFYKDLISGKMTQIDGLYCRVADYTKSQCG